MPHTSASFQSVRWGSRVAFVWLVAVCILTVLECTADSAEAFDQANVLYEQGNYPEAQAAYLALIEEGTASAAVYFNLGNTYYQSSQVGRALHAYFEALSRAPRDPDVLANIRFAREKLGAGAAIERTFWQQSLLQLTLNEWTFIAIALYWIWLLAAAAGQLLPKGSVPVIRGLTRLSGCAFFVAAALLTNAASDRLKTRYAVVATPEAVVRFGPFDESKSSHNMSDGMELQILDEKGGWYQIRDANQQSGWLRQDQVLVLRPIP